MDGTELPPKLEAFDSNGTLIRYKDRVRGPKGETGEVQRVHRPGAVYVVWDASGGYHAFDTVIEGGQVTVIDRAPDSNREKMAREQAPPFLTPDILRDARERIRRAMGNALFTFDPIDTAPVSVMVLFAGQSDAVSFPLPDGVERPESASDEWLMGFLFAHPDVISFDRDAIVAAWFE